MKKELFEELDNYKYFLLGKTEECYKEEIEKSFDELVKKIKNELQR